MLIGEIKLPRSGESMRTSSYVIYVDLPDTKDEMLLVHGYTGAYARVSRRVSAFLRRNEAGHVPRPLYGTWSDHALDDEPEVPSDATVEKLRERGYLTDMEVEEEQSFLFCFFLLCFVVWLLLVL